MLSLFGLVLAIGIVVDDAIVVVENVERNIALGLSPFEATQTAMGEVTGPIIATALVLCAVFIPTAFISGLTGQFYKQFAITIAISTVISAFNSLTLSPALCAVLLKIITAPEGLASRGSWIGSRLVLPSVQPVLRLVVATSIPRGVGRRSAQERHRARRLRRACLASPAGASTRSRPASCRRRTSSTSSRSRNCRTRASLDRTEAVIRRMTEIGLKHPGVEIRRVSRA